MRAALVLSVAFALLALSAAVTVEDDVASLAAPKGKDPLAAVEKKAGKAAPAPAPAPAVSAAAPAPPAKEKDEVAEQAKKKKDADAKAAQEAKILKEKKAAHGAKCKSLMGACNAIVKKQSKIKADFSKKYTDCMKIQKEKRAKMKVNAARRAALKKKLLHAEAAVEKGMKLAEKNKERLKKREDKDGTSERRTKKAVATVPAAKDALKAAKGKLARVTKTADAAVKAAHKMAADPVNLNKGNMAKVEAASAKAAKASSEKFMAEVEVTKLNALLQKMIGGEKKALTARKDEKKKLANRKAKTKAAEKKLAGEIKKEEKDKEKVAQTKGADAKVEAAAAKKAEATAQAATKKAEASAAKAKGEAKAEKKKAKKQEKKVEATAKADDAKMAAQKKANEAKKAAAKKAAAKAAKKKP